MKPLSVFRYTLEDNSTFIAVNFRKHTNVICGNRTLCSVDLDSFIAAIKFIGHEVSDAEILNNEDYVL